MVHGSSHGGRAAFQHKPDLLPDVLDVPGFKARDILLQNGRRRLADEAGLDILAEVQNFLPVSQGDRDLYTRSADL